MLLYILTIVSCPRGSVVQMSKTELRVAYDKVLQDVWRLVRCCISSATLMVHGFKFLPPLTNLASCRH